jgi:hypothetical protein
MVNLVSRGDSIGLANSCEIVAKVVAQISLQPAEQPAGAWTKLIHDMQVGTLTVATGQPACLCREHVGVLRRMTNIRVY